MPPTRARLPNAPATTASPNAGLSSASTSPMPIVPETLAASARSPSVTAPANAPNTTGASSVPVIVIVMSWVVPSLAVIAIRSTTTSPASRSWTRPWSRVYVQISPSSTRLPKTPAYVPPGKAGVSPGSASKMASVPVAVVRSPALPSSRSPNQCPMSTGGVSVGAAAAAAAAAVDPGAGATAPGAPTTSPARSTGPGPALPGTSKVVPRESTSPSRASRLKVTAAPRPPEPCGGSGASASGPAAGGSRALMSTLPSIRPCCTDAISANSSVPPNSIARCTLSSSSASEDSASDSRLPFRKSMRTSAPGAVTTSSPWWTASPRLRSLIVPSSSRTSTEPRMWTTRPMIVAAIEMLLCSLVWPLYRAAAATGPSYFGRTPAPGGLVL